MPLHASGLEWLQAALTGAVEPPPFVAALGLELVEVADDLVVARCVVRPEHMNGISMVHGGVIAAIADTAGSCAVLTGLPRGTIAPTLEMKVNFVRPVHVTDGPLRAEGRVLSRGRTTSLAEARVVDAEDRLVAFATVTCSVMRLDDGGRV